MPQVPFAFEFESERPNSNSVTKPSPNYHPSDLDKVGQTVERHLAIRLTFPKRPNGYSVTKQLPNYHSAFRLKRKRNLRHTECTDWIIFPGEYRKQLEVRVTREPGTRTLSLSGFQPIN